MSFPSTFNLPCYQHIFTPSLCTFIHFSFSVPFHSALSTPLLAQRTDGYSGSDVRLVCKEAAMRPVRKVFDKLDQLDSGKPSTHTHAHTHTRTHTHTQTHARAHTHTRTRAHTLPACVYMLYSCALIPSCVHSHEHVRPITACMPPVLP